MRETRSRCRSRCGPLLAGNQPLHPLELEEGEFAEVDIAESVGVDGREALLDELVILNILRREERDGGRWYMFSRSSFLEMLGSEDDVIGSLMETLEKEAARA